MPTTNPPATHRVVACQGGAATRIEHREIPVPADDEILLGLRVVGLCGTDLFKLDNGLAEPGTVLGHELVGEVLRCGGLIEGFAPGDRVAVPHHVHCGQCPLCLRGNETMCEQFRENLLFPGAFSERILVRGRAAAVAARKVPDGVADEAAVFMEPAACVLRGIRRSGLGPQGVAVIQGGGSMGLLHLLVLRGAHPHVRVVVVDPLPARQALARRLGAFLASGIGDDATAAVADASHGLGADAVFDTVGGGGPLAAAVALSREGGSVVLFAHAPHGERASIDLNDLFKYERRILGTYSGGLTEQAAVFTMMVEGKFDPGPLVSHRLALDEFQTGVDLSHARQALKVLYHPIDPTPA